MRFYLFDSGHIAALSVILILGILLLLAAWRRPPLKLDWLGRVLGVVLVSYGAAAYAQLWLAGGLSPSIALPLELCHWVLIACVISLFRPNRFTAEIAYFWGFAGTLQAVLTPDISTGFPSWEFLLFFWGHGASLLAIIFIVAVQGHIPRKGSVVRMMLAVNIYAMVAGTFDLAFGWNYGYLRAKPMRPSLLDYMGPWPWYILSLEVAALTFFLILDVPWKIVRSSRPEPGSVKDA